MYKSKETYLGLGGALFGIGFMLVFMVGWIMNIVKVIGLNFDAITGEHVIRIAGIFLAPVGGVAGYF